MNRALTSSEKLLAEGSSILIALPWEAKAAAFAEAFRALGWSAEVAPPGSPLASDAKSSGFEVVIRADFAPRFDSAAAPEGDPENGGETVRIAVVARQPSRATAPIFSAIFDPSTPLFDIAAAALSLSRASRGRAMESCDPAPSRPVARAQSRVAAPPVAPASTAPPEPMGEEDAARVLSGFKMRDAERLIITAAIKECGSAPKAARRLGLSPSTLYRKMEGWAAPSA